MKKTIRIILPIILVLAIILCTAWYLLIYDRSFTQEMLLIGARHFDSVGKHNISGWLYDIAYRNTGDHTSIAIELAEQHKRDGNYTKAEYTLTKAIADGGSIELYIALSKTFVEQDKLLDAVAMLNNVTNPEIKEQLDQLRPAAPTCSPDPGSTGAYHTSYITVSLRAETGTLYANPYGEFPSIERDLYTDGIQLVDGENIIYAVAVDENGLVSPAAVFGFTVGGIIEELIFEDAVIEKYIRDLLNVGEDTVIYTNDLWNIEQFTVPAGATSLADLKHFLFLKDLTIENCVGGQIQFISKLNELTHLTIIGTPITAEELPLIGNLPNLVELTLNDCRLSTVSGLENAVNLTYLDLGNNTIRNIEPLSAMSKLQFIDLQHNALNDLTALSSLYELSSLNVAYNMLMTLSPVCNITTLVTLDAGHNSIIDLNGLQNLTELEHLNLEFNSVADVAPIAACKQLTYLNISNNTVVDISSMSELVSLATFNFSNNQVSRLPEFSKDSLLVHIDGSHNLLDSLDALEGLTRLNNVYMDYNSDISSVECLANCPVLIQVNVFGTRVTKVSSLTSQSIVVNFNPTQ